MTAQPLPPGTLTMLLTDVEGSTSLWAQHPHAMRAAMERHHAIAHDTVAFAAEACAEAVRLVSDAVGTSSIRLAQPFERYFRDAHVLAQHSSKSSPRYGSAGRLMFGLESDWVWLTF